MRAFFQTWREAWGEVPGAFRAALALALGFVGFVAWDQSHWWSVKEDYSFGWLVPALVAFVVVDRWALIRASLASCAATGSECVQGWRANVLRVVAGLVAVTGAGFFLLGLIYRAGVGSSYPGTLAITLGMIGIVFPLLWWNAPMGESPRAGDFARDARLRLVGLFVFPVMVWWVSAPMVSAVEQRLQPFLLHQVVTVVAFVFDLLGLPVEQQGNVLVLPLGSVGVEDACSGIRSLTACVFAGSFLAAVFVRRLGPKVFFVVAALGLAFVTNLARGLFLTGWAYAYGASAIEGAVHDVAGFAVLGLTVAGLLALLPVINWWSREDNPAAGAAETR